MKASIRKYILLKCFILLFPLCLSASPRQGQDLILPGHWVYDALHRLELETKTLTFSDIAPLSIQEFKSYFSMIDKAVYALILDWRILDKSPLQLILPYHKFY